MKGNYIDLARYLDKVQKGCRVRTITFDHLKILIQLVRGGAEYMAIDGGCIAPESCYPGQTTLAIVAYNSDKELVIGIQRCKALIGAPWGPHNPVHLNRGIWELISNGTALDMNAWANYYGPEQRFILESTELEV